jgi:hypothetical protein
MTKKTPSAPSVLSNKSRAVWRAILGEFELEAESLETLRVALENLDLADTARELLRTEGLVVAGKPHPASNSVKLHDGLYLRSMRALGLDIVQPGPIGRPVGR